MGTRPKVVAAIAPTGGTPQAEPTAADASFGMAPAQTTKPDDIAPTGREASAEGTGGATMTEPMTTTIPVPSLGPADMTKGMEKVMKSTEELVAFSQGNVEAFVKSSQIWSAGIQDLSKQVAATAQANFDETMNAFKAITSAKSLKDAFDMQASFARTAFEKSMAESGKLTDASFKLTEQAIAPISQRVTVAIESIVKTA